MRDPSLSGHSQHLPTSTTEPNLICRPELSPSGGATLMTWRGEKASLDTLSLLAYTRQ